MNEEDKNLKYKQNLKIEALLQKISSLTATYENQVADLRVDLTIQDQELQQLREQLKNVQNSSEDDGTE